MRKRDDSLEGLPTALGLLFGTIAGVLAAIGLGGLGLGPPSALAIPAAVATGLWVGASKDGWA